MSTYSKFYDPNTEAFVYKDCITGADVDPSTIVPCPLREVISEKVCITPNANVVDGAAVDTSLVVDGKCITTIEIDVANDTTAVIGAPIITDTAGTDVAATHTVVPCPSDLVFAGEGCYEGEGK